MSAQEPSIDLVAVACVVDSSLLLASEWSRILIEYVYPLLKRLNELHPSHQFRLAFVTYGAADTRPQPLLSRRFFAPLSQVSKLLREEPSELGIGQTNSGSGRGLSALEGLVAAIELFDVLMTSTNFAVSHPQTQSLQKDSRSLISHLLHIAASPPDNAQKPHCNTLQHLDSVNWDSIPAELKKRKINLSLISLREIPQFQKLQLSVAGPGAQSPWFNVRAPHILSLAGFPVPKTVAKRQTDTLPSDPSPDSKRQKVVTDISKPSPASPALSPSRPPRNRSQQPISSQAPQPPPSTTSGGNSSPAQPIQPTPTMPASTPAASATATPLPASAPAMSHINPQVLDQVVTTRGVKFGQMMERLRALEKELVEMESQISNTQSAGQAAILAGLQKDRDTKVRFKEYIKSLLMSHYQKMVIAKGAMTAQAGAAGSAPQNAESGPSSQSYPSNVSNTSSKRPAGPMTDEQKPPMTDMAAQFLQPRGTASAPSGPTPQAPSSQNQPHPAVTPESAAQIQKLMEQRGIRPPNFGPSQTRTNPHEISGTSNATDTQHVQTVNTSMWQGTFSAAFLGGQGTNEIQLHVIGYFDQPLQADRWPKNFVLKAFKEPLKDMQELTSWLKPQSRTHKMQFKPNSRVPDGLMNEQKFQELIKFMTDSRIYAYTGLHMPSGKFMYNMIIFPLHSLIAGVFFPEGLPGLPGAGNMLDNGPPSPEVIKPLSLSGLNISPTLIARMQTMEPAQQKRFIAHIIRVQQQGQLRRQLQQAQQPHAGSSQAANSHGMPVPYRAAATMPPGIPTNANVATNAGAFNTGGGTVNYEMLQSFMQRSAEGSTSQGTNPG